MLCQNVTFPFFNKKKTEESGGDIYRLMEHLKHAQICI